MLNHSNQVYSTHEEHEFLFGEQSWLELHLLTIFTIIPPVTSHPWAENLRVSLNETPQFPFWGLYIFVDIYIMK